MNTQETIQQPERGASLPPASGSAIPLPHHYAFSHESPSRKLWDEDDMRDHAADVLKESKLALLTWAVARWTAEVSQRPLVNVHRRTLDDTWRQVIRFAGGNPDELIGAPHDELLRVTSPNDKVSDAPDSAAPNRK